MTNCFRLLLDSGVSGFHAVHKSPLIYKVIEKEGLEGRDRDKNRTLLLDSWGVAEGQETNNSTKECNKALPRLRAL